VTKVFRGLPPLCATADATEVVLGVVDGFAPKGVEDEGEIRWRKDFLRKIDYKLRAGETSDP
jgi:adenosine/AMP kinase